MGGKYGVEEVRKPVLAVAELANVIDDVLNADGNFLQRGALLAGAFDELIVLFSTDFDKLRLELGELDLEDRTALVGEFKKKFDLDSDRTEEVVERSFDILNNLYYFVREGVGVAKMIKDGKIVPPVATSEPEPEEEASE